MAPEKSQGARSGTWHRKARLGNRVAVVTGASRGIGRAVAKAYAREGAQVVVLARHVGPLRKVAREIMREGGECLAIRCDVSKAVQVKRAVTETMNRFGKIDVLINNAGILTPKGPIQQVKVEDWEDSLAVNLTGTFLPIKFVLPVMLERRSGAILNVSSGAGKREAPLWGSYAVSKFGVEGLTKVVAAEVRSQGIRVNAVNPGGVRTEMRRMAYPEENPMSLPTPEEVAELFVYLASSESAGVTGQSIEFRDWVRSHKSGGAP